MTAPLNTFEAPPRTARVSELPPPPPSARPVTTPVPSAAFTATGTTGQGLLTPDLPGHGAPQGIPRPAETGPRLTPAPQPQRPNVMTLPAVNLLAPQHSTAPGAPKPSIALNPSALFEAPSDSIKKIRARQRRRRLKNVISTFVLLALVAGGAFAWTKFRPTSEAADAPPHPAVWDTRVQELVAFVERTRELTFEHPVTIEFLPPAEYQQRLREDWVDVSDDEKKDAAYEEELNDLFGLTATYHYLEDRGAIESLASLGFYSPSTDTIVVKGEQLTPGVRATVVHELTHALQAQRLNVGDRIGDRSTRSVAEADAMEIEGAYREAMSPEDRWNASEESKLSEADEAALNAVPWTLTELEYAPYRLGRLAMDRRTTSGNAGLNEALAEPPTEWQMIAPWSNQIVDPVHVPTPAGVTVVRENEQISVVEMLVALDAWLPWTAARSALDTWDGGGYTTYRRTADGPLCADFRVVVRGDATWLGAVITYWTTAMGAPATPVVNGSDLTFSLCARGKGAPEPPAPVVTPTMAVEVEIATVPAELYPPVTQPGAAPIMTIAEPGKPTVADYLCVARAVVDDPALAPLISELFPTPQQKATLDKGFDRAARRCVG